MTRDRKIVWVLAIALAAGGAMDVRHHIANHSSSRTAPPAFDIKLEREPGYRCGSAPDPMKESHTYTCAIDTALIRAPKAEHIWIFRDGDLVVDVAGPLVRYRLQPGEVWIVAAYGEAKANPTSLDVTLLNAHEAGVKVEWRRFTVSP